MAPKKYNQRQTTIEPTNISIHPFLELYTIVPSEYFKNEWLDFMSLRQIIVDRKGRLISGVSDVLAAQSAGITQLSALEVDMNELDLVRFINLELQTLKKDYRTQFNMILFLEEYLEKDGKLLADKLQGDKYEKIGEMMDCSKSKVQNILYIGKHDPTAFDMISSDKNEGGIGFTEALNAVRNMVKETGIPTGKGGRIGTTKTTISSFPLANATLSIPKMGDLQLTTSNSTPIVMFNGQSISDVQYGDFDEIDNHKKKVGACRYVFQSQNMKSSIHIIINNPEELFK